MARETAAQRNARYDAENEARLSQEVAEYPQRLMVTLARATNAYFELTVSDNKFLVTADPHRERTTFRLDYTHSPNSQEVLQELEWTLDRHERELAEQKRLVEVRKEAVRKVNELLSKEERELLNLLNL